MIKPCFICGGGAAGREVLGYSRCAQCGHETLITTDQQQYIVNDDLSEPFRDKPDAACRFQLEASRLAAKGRRLLIDVGCGSGKFLRHMNGYFDWKAGIEVSEPSFRFARDVMKLDVYADLKDVSGSPDLVTFWHSLEHIPAPAIEELLERLSHTLSADGRLLISVPNTDSFQYRLFGSSFAYYDVPNHLHQFSVTSLSRLVQRFGFVPERTFYSGVYSLFGCTQGCLNKILPIHNYLYYRKKRGWSFDVSSLRRRCLDIANLVLLPFVALPAAAIAILEVLFPTKQGSVTICFRKKD